MHLNIDQNTEVWLQARSGKLTGSAVAKVMANFGKAFGEPAKKLAVDIALEQVRGIPISSNYSNGHMERGHIEEPIARQRYEAEYFCKVDNGGFFDNGETGCSPDGLVDDDGVVEIKSAIPSIHYARIEKNSYDSAYKWQLLFNLREVGRSWIDFVSFCSTYTPDKNLFVHRLYAKDFDVEFIQMNERINEFNKLVATVKRNIE